MLTVSQIRDSIPVLNENILADLQDMETIKLSDAPARLPELTKRCAYGGESFLFTNYGKEMAQLVPVGGKGGQDIEGAPRAAGEIPASNGVNNRSAAGDRSKGRKRKPSKIKAD